MKCHELKRTEFFKSCEPRTWTRTTSRSELRSVWQLSRKGDYSCLVNSFNRFGGARYYYSWRTAQLCVNGCGEAETAQYLLISFNRFQDLWYLVRDWICVFTTEPFCISDHFLQFTNLTGCLLARRSFMQLILLTCVWVLWTESNNRLFIHKKNSIDQLLLHKVKIHFY